MNKKWMNSDKNLWHTNRMRYKNKMKTRSDSCSLTWTICNLILTSIRSSWNNLKIVLALRYLVPLTKNRLLSLVGKWITSKIPFSVQITVSWMCLIVTISMAVTFSNLKWIISIHNHKTTSWLTIELTLRTLPSKRTTICFLNSNTILPTRSPRKLWLLQTVTNHTTTK